ncbi:MAG: glutamate-1-semialdehyde 2,1-aminomutase [Planctomycetota bacterium]
MSDSNSKQLGRLANQLIPGGCHTYAKGDDQFPVNAPPIISHGRGCRVWDADGNEYIEFGLGCRAVSLGHAFEPVVEAVRNELLRGVNFSRASVMEVRCAEMLLNLIEPAEMVKFCKDGSDATTAALKLARAVTGRDMVAICKDQPFFSINDWFIGTTTINAGIPESVKQLTKGFRYNDPDSLEDLFRRYPGQIACVILEAEKYSPPEDNFLFKVQEICRANGALFVLDEMITGFRWHNRGAQHVYGLDPDLSTFGKALANGFSVSALLGKRKYMERGGLYHDSERVFLLSTTHGAETHGLAAAMATMQFYMDNPVIQTLEARGDQLRAGICDAIDRQGLSSHVGVIGRSSNLVFTTRDAEGRPCQEFRTLLMQELIRRGILGTSLVVSYSHTPEDIETAIRAFEAALPIYKSALERGPQQFLTGRPTSVVYRRFNGPSYSSPPAND